MRRVRLIILIDGWSELDAAPLQRHKQGFVITDLVLDLDLAHCASERKPTRASRQTVTLPRQSGRREPTCRTRGADLPHARQSSQAARSSRS